jgi:ribonuclease HIII
MSDNVVRKISADAGEGLRGELEAAGFEFREQQHARFSARGPGANVVLYNSGKLVVQGKGALDFAATYLGGEAIAAPTDARDVVDEPIIGTDESGKGDYFGPLVVAAVLLRPEDVEVLRTLGVRDSKTVSDKAALEIAEVITTGYGDRVAVVSIGPRRYNELHVKFGRNLNRLLAWAHARAIEDVLEHHDCGRALSDKFASDRLILSALMERGRGLRLDQRVRAEAHPAVAAASIVARARFLRDLEHLGFDAGEKLPKGAGAQVDLAARRIFRSGGMDALGQVAKLHFRTTEKARG